MSKEAPASTQEPLPVESFDISGGVHSGSFCLWSMNHRFDWKRWAPLVHSLFALHRVAALEAACSSRSEWRPLTRSQSAVSSSKTLQQQQVALATVPVAVTKQSKKLRDREDEIFQLWHSAAVEGTFPTCPNAALFWFGPSGWEKITAEGGFSSTWPWKLFYTAAQFEGEILLFF